MITETPLIPVRNTIAFLDDGDHASLITAIEQSTAWFAPGSRDRAALEALTAFLRTSPSAKALAEYVSLHFEVREARGGKNGKVLFTGYYEPVIEGSLLRDATYATPIYGPPPDLIEAKLGAFNAKYGGDKIYGRLSANAFVPYFTRAEIAKGALADAPVIAWAKDPVALFFAEVQGSASLRLPDGSLKRIGFAAKNGRPYRSLGTKLINEKVMKKEDVSLQSIRAYLAANGNELLAYNESYVFFRFLDGLPLGALGKAVTPERSIATDLGLFPKGALAFLSLELPVANGTTRRFHRFVLNQDTGGAIVGPGRTDIFFGQGEYAEYVAGHLKAEGRLFFFTPRP